MYFQRDLGTRVTGTAGTFTTFTLTADLRAGEDFVLFLGTNNTTATITSVTDDAGGATNTYTVALTVTSSGRCGYIVACPQSKALPAGATITVNFSASVAAKAMCACAFWGAAVPAADQTANATGTSTSPNSGATPAQSQILDMALGLIVTDGVSGDAFTIGGGYTSLTGVFNTTTANVAIYPAYKLLGSSTAAETYSATITSRTWAAGVVTVKNWTATAGLRIVTQEGVEIATRGDNRAASSVTTEVAATGPSRAASSVGAEAAVTGLSRAVSTIGVEIAYVSIPSVAIPRRVSPQVVG